MTSRKRNKFRGRRSKRAQNLKHSFKKVSVSYAQLAHFSTLAKEKHMLLILNFSTLTFITNARTTMLFARLHSQMVCTQSEPAEIPQHMFVQILVQVGGDRKRRTSRTTLDTRARTHTRTFTCAHTHAHSHAHTHTHTNTHTYTHTHTRAQAHACMQLLSCFLLWFYRNTVVQSRGLPFFCAALITSLLAALAATR